MIIAFLLGVALGVVIMGVGAVLVTREKAR